MIKSCLRAIYVSYQGNDNSYKKTSNWYLQPKLIYFKFVDATVKRDPLVTLDLKISVLQVIKIDMISAAYNQPLQQMDECQSTSAVGRQTVLSLPYSLVRANLSTLYFFYLTIFPYSRYHQDWQQWNNILLLSCAYISVCVCVCVCVCVPSTFNNLNCLFEKTILLCHYPPVLYSFNRYFRALKWS